MLTFGLSGCAKNTPAEPIVVSEETTAPVKAPELKKGLETFLVLGLDDYERPEKSVGYLNGMQSDFLLLVVVDADNHKIQALHINRDTMTKVPRLGVFGDAAGNITGQIALAHTYGSGGSDSCLNAVKAVSNFLGGVKIDHYMTFTMDSVAVINDMIGGVTVLVEDDFSEADPTIVQGQEITLKGSQALTYVRGRGSVGDKTNISRMKRQRQYMFAMYEKVIEASKSDENFIKNLTLKLADSFMTDCTINQLETLALTIGICEMEPFLTIDGEAKVGEKFMEFYADPESVQAAVNKLFYEP